MKLDAKEREALRAALAKIGAAGGRASAKKLTKAQRIAKARKAGKAGGRGRTLASYINKYGEVEGAKMYRTLQREAAHASVHARRKKVGLSKKGEAR